MRFLQALTPRASDCRPDFTNPSEPLSRHGKGGGGKGQMLPQATLGAILCAVRIDFRLPPQINPYPAQPATGVLGQSPKRVLVPFTRVKGTPRRRAVQTKFSIKLAPPKATTNYFTNTPAVAVQIITFYKARPAAGDYRLCHDRHPTTPIPLRARFARPKIS